MHAEDSRVKVVHLSRNFGHQAALQAGIDAARGRAVVLMDADLQDRPEDLRVFFARWRDGYDVVYAIRTDRKEGRTKRTAYSLFYRTLRMISEVDVAVDAGDFSLIDRPLDLGGHAQPAGEERGRPAVGATLDSARHP